MRDELKSGGYEADGECNGAKGDGGMGVLWKGLCELMLYCWIVEGRDIQSDHGTKNVNGVEEFDAEVKGSSDLFSGIVEEAKDNRGDKSAGNGGYKEVGIDGSVINSSLDLKLG